MSNQHDTWISLKMEDTQELPSNMVEQILNSHEILSLQVVPELTKGQPNEGMNMKKVLPADSKISFVKLSSYHLVN